MHTHLHTFIQECTLSACQLKLLLLLEGYMSPEHNSDDMLCYAIIVRDLPTDAADDRS